LLPSRHMHWNISIGRNPYRCSNSFIMSYEILIMALGMKRFPAGRLGDGPSIGLSASLKNAGFKLGRLQTGTPARLDGNTINFNGLKRQDGDSTPAPFSFLNSTVDNAVRSLSFLKPLALFFLIGFYKAQPTCMLFDCHNS
jgi:Glucose inhibited division protein A